jgi:hypothetical protein
LTGLPASNAAAFTFIVGRRLGVPRPVSPACATSARAMWTNDAAYTT